MTNKTVESDNMVLFEKFYREQYGKVINYTLKKIGAREDAEDIVQNAFASCYKNLDSYDNNKSTIATWVYVSVNNRIKNYYRDRKLNEDIDEYAEFFPDSNLTEADQVHYIKECRNVLERILKKLPERSGAIIKMRYFEDCSMKEIAGELNMTEVNVRVSIGRILKQMKALLAEEGWREEDI